MVNKEFIDDFAVLDKNELNKNSVDEDDNLKEKLVKLGFVDYDNLSDEQKKKIDELENF